MQISMVYLSILTFTMTSVVVGNAFYKNKQFYPTVVHITKSSTSMAIIYIQFFVVVLIFGKLLRKIFLGTLRSTEFEHLLERFWYALTETCLAFTVFRDDFNPRFVALFTVLLFLKSFHWLADERVDFMERSPILGWLFHVRVVSLLCILGCMDYYLLIHAYNSTLIRGPTVQLVFGFEYGILLTSIASISIKYLLHTAEMHSENPWENKAVFLLYTELIIGLIKVILYVLFVVIMAKIYALPMFVFRPMFFTMRSFKKALSDVIMSRRAIRNMNTLYPDATSEELQMSDNICIICREDMLGNSKKLPCGHIFHTSCLRSWFQRQQTCPTCRLNILRNNTTNPPPPREAEEEETPDDPTAADYIPGTSNEEPTQEAESQNVNHVPQVPPQLGPASVVFPTPIPFLAHYAVPMPPIPPNLSSLTEEELRLLEGNERQNIEARLKLLENVKLLIDASTILMSQYAMINACNNAELQRAHTFSTTTQNATMDKEKVINDTESKAPPVVKEEQTPESNLPVPQSVSKVDGTSVNVDLNAVKLEDVEEEGQTSQVSDNIEDIISTELNELRKRRLKYLHETTQN